VLLQDRLGKAVDIGDARDAQPEGHKMQCVHQGQRITVEGRTTPGLRTVIAGGGIGACLSTR